MKTVKSLIALALLVLVTGVLSAQPQRNMRAMGPAVMPPELVESLNLTDAQKVKLFDLRTQHAKDAAEMRTANRSGDLSPNQIRENRVALQSRHDAQLKSILSEEQFNKIAAFRAERQEQNRSFRDGRRGQMQPGQRGGMMPGQRGGQRPGRGPGAGNNR